jgi:hypothetical protein
VLAEPGGDDPLGPGPVGIAPRDGGTGAGHARAVAALSGAVGNVIRPSAALSLGS